MPELSHDAAEEGFHEIQLSGKQIVFLVMVVTVISAVIFLCGVLVGRSVATQRGDSVADEPMTSASPTPPPATDAGPPATEPPTPAAEPSDELSYHKRLQGETAPAEQLKPEAAQPPPPAAAPAPAPVPKPAPVSDVPTAGRPGSWIVQVTALRDANAARNLVKGLAGKGFPAFIVNPAADMPVIYRVQVGGYGTRGEAEDIARRIEKEEQFKPQVRQAR